MRELDYNIFQATVLDIVMKHRAGAANVSADESDILFFEELEVYISSRIGFLPMVAFVQSVTAVSCRDFKNNTKRF